MATAIEQLDSLIYETGDHPLRPSATADILAMQLPLLLRVLNQYVDEGLLRAEQWSFCRICDLVLDDGDDALWCDSCERTMKDADVHVETVFAPIEPIVRIDIDPTAVPQSTPSVIQFIAGDRGGSHQSQVQSPREFREMRDALGACTYRDRLTLAAPIHAATALEITMVYRENPNILHFVGHGDDRSLSVLQDRGALVTARPLTAEQLLEILQNFPYRVAVCVFNTCNSVAIAAELTAANAVDIAFGWNGRVPDAIAVDFARALYVHLGEGISVGHAFGLAKACSMNESAEMEMFHATAIDPRATFAIRV